MIAAEADLFEISDDAMELIRKQLENALEGRPDLRRGNSNVGLRLNFNQRGAYFSLAFPRPDDQVLNYMGRPLVIIDHKDLPRLDGVYLTVQEGPNGCKLSMAPRLLDPTSCEQVP